MIVAAIILIALGLVVALLGFKLFRILLPIIGFIGGLMVGFGGFQAVFGTGAVSTTIAIMMALIVGVVLAILSYAFFEIAVIVIAAIVGASALSFLGIALGLNEDGFLVFLLALSGAIIAATLAVAYHIAPSFVLALTSAFGVAAVMGGIMLIVGNVTLDEMHNQGVIKTVVSVVDQSFLWFIVWIGASLFAMQFQARLILQEFATDAYQFDPKKFKKS